MRLLHLITGLSTGGAENMLFKLLSEMDRHKYESCVVSLLPGGKYAESITEIGVPVMDLGLRARTPSPIGLFRLRDIAQDFRADLIQTWMYHANILASIATLLKLIHQPVIWNVRHALDDLKREKTSTRLAIRLGASLSRQPQRIVFNSWTAKAQHTSIGYCAQRSEVIPNGFNCAIFAPCPGARQRLRRILAINPKQFCVLHLARLHPVKDHATFLAAARELMNDPRFIFVLAGINVEADNRLLGRELAGLDPARFRLLGEREDTRDLLAAADVLCLSSSTEAFPNVLGEAMATGVPCVATDVGDSARIVGDTGVIVSARDPRALAEALTGMAELSFEERSSLGAAARARIVELYSLEKIARTYENLYDAILAEEISCPSNREA